jgi:Plus-3 domain
MSNFISSAFRLLAMDEVEREAILYERARQREGRAARRAVAAKAADKSAMKVQKDFLSKSQAPVQLKVHNEAAMTKQTAAPLYVRPTGPAGTSKAETLKATLQAHTLRSEEQKNNRQLQDLLSPIDSDDLAASFGEGAQRDKGQAKPEVSSEASEADVLGAWVGRETLVSWMDRPWFTTETLGGLFLRLCVGRQPGSATNAYRVVRLDAVEENSATPLYRIGERATKARLLVSLGRATKVIRLDALSNGPPTERETRRYLAEVAHAGLSMPSRNALTALATVLADLHARPVTHEDIAFALKKKADMDTLYVNPARRWTQLVDARDLALQEGDLERVALLDAQLKAAAAQANSLEASQSAPSRLPAPASRRAPVVASRQPDATNPFARRKTQSTFASAVFSGSADVHLDSSDTVIKNRYGTASSPPQPTDISLRHKDDDDDSIFDDLDIDVPGIPFSSQSLHYPSSSVSQHPTGLFSALDLYTAKASKNRP